MVTSAKLISEEGSQKGLVLSLEEGDEWIIGRDPDESTFVLEDPSASRKHLILRLSTEGILLENLSETNPTEVNGQPATEPLLLNQGDTIRIGNNLFRFYSSDEAQITEKEADIHDTIFEEEGAGKGAKNELADIDFDLMGTGRWLLKVISGPNNGAEYNMHASASYVIGTDPNSCDIVYHDTSVSRQHARITIDENDVVTIEDLGSRNGTLVDGKRIDSPHTLESNTLVSLGTTSFLIFDREGEMQTIVSPILPSLAKALKPEEEKEEEAIEGPSEEVHEAAKYALEEKVIKPTKKKTSSAFGAFVLAGILGGFFLVAGLGTLLLFRSEPIAIQEEIDTEQILQEALAPFPDIRRNFNKNTGQLLLIGHVLTPTDKSQLLYNLQGLRFIKNIDDSGIIIDEYVWRNYNQILSKNRDWKGVTIHSPKPGKFVLTGYLKTRKEAEEVYDYLNTHFSYLDRLDKEIIIEEDVVNTLLIKLRNQGFTGINVEMNNNVVTLSGSIPPAKSKEFNNFVSETKKAMPEVRNIKTFVQELAPEKSVINITDTYQVSGVSKIGKTLNVVINGRILTKGDILDGMRITDISGNTIWLEKDNVKYRIDY